MQYQPGFYFFGGLLGRISILLGSARCSISSRLRTTSRNVFRLELPCLCFGRRVSAEVGVNAAGADVADLDVVFADFLHQHFGKAVEAEFRSVVSGHSRIRVLARERRNLMM